MSKSSTKCTSKPTLQQLFEGIQAVSSNAESLYLDSLLLFQSGRHPRAAALAILSIEELGKTLILAMMALADDAEDLAGLWKDFQNHTSKNFPGVFVNRILAGDRTADEFRSKLVEGARDLNDIKKKGIYVDYSTNNQWLTPTDEITASVAEYYVQIAGGLQIRGLTFDIFDLFIKYFKPLWKADYETKKEAMLKLLGHPGVPKELFNFGLKFFGVS
jgi:AbiV family abortive infection protein